MSELTRHDPGHWHTTTGGPDLYVASPAGKPAHGVVVVGHELFGVTPWVRRMCGRFAEVGWAAIAPDYYGRSGTRRVSLGEDEVGRARGFRLMGALTREGVEEDTRAALALAAALPADAPRGYVGFSLGGHLGTLAATRIPFDLVVSVYGGWTIDGGIPLAAPEAPLSESGAAAIARHGTRMLGIVGDRDHLIDADERHRIAQRLAAAGVPHELRVYEGAQHAFLREDRPETYDAGAAEDAFGRIVGALEGVRRGGS
ncbi:dienelactone hydrolase family protein [Streptomyces sp. NPDC091385]|uniref:dienelactone hydrolase family protein n=1 Tax=Streptomyces sp. NPDC091385 TaxID=3365997 RepID=UPI00380B7970